VNVLVDALSGRWPEIWLRTLEHLMLTGISTVSAVAVGVPLGVLLAPTLTLWTAGERARGSGGRVSVCTKNFTEQIVLGELIAQAIERRTDLEVDRRFNMGGTVICHRALVEGEIDIYAEYTGTALTAILDETPAPGSDTRAVLNRVREAYEARYGVRWLEPFGFDNTYVLLADRALADSLDWSRVSDTRSEAPSLEVGFTAEFAERPDGYPGFTEHYDLRFGAARDLDPGILYRAASERAVDVVFGFATDGRIDPYDLVPLEDDRAFFPPYEAAPLVRTEVLEAFPELAETLRALGGVLPDTTMRRLNRSADAGEASIAEIVRDFLDGLEGF